MTYSRRDNHFGRKMENNVYGRVNDVSRSIILRCGCDAIGSPSLSNPERWWCCGAWQKKKS